MIDFHGTWLVSLFRYVDIIIDRSILENDWLTQNKRMTSIDDFDELMFQIYDGLDSDYFIDKMNEMNSSKNIDCFIFFLNSLKGIQQNDYKDLKTLLDSDEWAQIIKNAKMVLDCKDGIMEDLKDASF